MLILTSTTGRLGAAILASILEHELIPPKQILICTSSNSNDPRWNTLRARGATVRQIDYCSHESLKAAFHGGSKLLLTPSPDIKRDFNNPEVGKGREEQHTRIIRAARAAGVRHIYYTSLALNNNASAGLVQAHCRTERYLALLTDTSWTIIREGLFSETWPMYLGDYNIHWETRQQIVVAGDGPISFASVEDLGLATAMIVTDMISKYQGVVVTLSGNETVTLQDIVKLVQRHRQGPLELRVVQREVYEQYYIQERGLDPGLVRWWSTIYDALKENSAMGNGYVIEKMLGKYGRKPKPLRETIKEMLDPEAAETDGTDGTEHA